MKTARPGIADGNRPRLGAFVNLVDQILSDDAALDGLAFAYAALEQPERRALAHAVVQDAGNPTQALMALLTVEEDPRLRQRLAGLISRHGRIDRSAFLEGSEEQGRASLLQSLPGLDSEALGIIWKHSKIESIEIESRMRRRLDPSAAEVAIAEVVEALAPMVWRYIRSGGKLPDGIERFAGFFSLG